MKTLIDLVTQQTHNSCVSACLSMVLKEEQDVIISEFHDLYMANRLQINEYLNTKGIKYRRCLADERSIDDNCVYIMSVPSLNNAGGTHAIVIEGYSSTNWFLHDPNNGRNKRLNYLDHTKTGGQMCWSPMYEFKKTDLIKFWKDNGVYE